MILNLLKYFQWVHPNIFSKEDLMLVIDANDMLEHNKQEHQSEMLQYNVVPSHKTVN